MVARHLAVAVHRNVAAACCQLLMEREGVHQAADTNHLHAARSTGVNPAGGYRGDQTRLAIHMSGFESLFTLHIMHASFHAEWTQFAGSM